MQITCDHFRMQSVTFIWYTILEKKKKAKSHAEAASTSSTISRISSSPRLDLIGRIGPELTRSILTRQQYGQLETETNGEVIMENKAIKRLALLLGVALMFCGCGVSKEYVKEEMDKTRNEVAVDVDAKITVLKGEFSLIRDRINDLNRKISLVSDQSTQMQVQMLRSLELERTLLEKQLKHVDGTIADLRTYK